MTVRELITELEKIENKELTVIGLGRDDCADVTEVKISTWKDVKNNAVELCEIRLEGC